MYMVLLEWDSCCSCGYVEHYIMHLKQFVQYGRDTFMCRKETTLFGKLFVTDSTYIYVHNYLKCVLVTIMGDREQIIVNRLTF